MVNFAKMTFFDLWPLRTVRKVFSIFSKLVLRERPLKKQHHGGLRFLISSIFAEKKGSNAHARVLTNGYSHAYSYKHTKTYTHTHASNDANLLTLSLGQEREGQKGTQAGENCQARCCRENWRADFDRRGSQFPQTRGKLQDWRLHYHAWHYENHRRPSQAYWWSGTFRNAVFDDALFYYPYMCGEWMGR